MAKVHRADPNITAMNIHRFETGNYGKPNEANLLMAEDMQKRKDNQSVVRQQVEAAKAKGLVEGKDYATSGKDMPSNPYFSNYGYENLAHTNEEFKNLSQEQRLDNKNTYRNIPSEKLDLLAGTGIEQLLNFRTKEGLGLETITGTNDEELPPVAESAPPATNPTTPQRSTSGALFNPYMQQRRWK